MLAEKEEKNKVARSRELGGSQYLVVYCLGEKGYVNCVSINNAQSSIDFLLAL